VKVIVEAYNNPTVAAKHEVEIGELMAKAEKASSKSTLALRGPRTNPTKQKAQQHRDGAVSIVLNHLMRHGALSREELFAGLRAAGTALSRDTMMYALLSCKERRVVTTQVVNNKTYWLVADNK
jgi:hypothetical protein